MSYQDQISRATDLSRALHSMHFRCLFRVMKDAPLHPGQPPILRALADAGKCSQRELAARLTTSSASVGVSLRRLEKQGYVAREQSEQDCRSNTISLTESGRAALEQTDAMNDMLMRHMVSDFSPEELNLYNNLQQRALESLKRCYAGLSGCADETAKRSE